MTNKERDAVKAQLDRAEGIITAHVHGAIGRPGSSPRIGMFNAVVGRAGGRLEIVLDADEAEAFARYLETRVPDGDA